MACLFYWIEYGPSFAVTSQHLSQIVPRNPPPADELILTCSFEPDHAVSLPISPILMQDSTTSLPISPTDWAERAVWLTRESSGRAVGASSRPHTQTTSAAIRRRQTSGPWFNAQRPPLKWIRYYGGLVDAGSNRGDSDARSGCLLNHVPPLCRPYSGAGSA